MIDNKTNKGGELAPYLPPDRIPLCDTRCPWFDDTDREPYGPAQCKLCKGLTLPSATHAEKYCLPHSVGLAQPPSICLPMLEATLQAIPVATPSELLSVRLIVHTFIAAERANPGANELAVRAIDPNEGRSHKHAIADARLEATSRCSHCGGLEIVRNLSQHFAPFEFLCVDCAEKRKRKPVRYVKCSRCAGSGSDMNGERECRACTGVGMVLVAVKPAGSPEGRLDLLSLEQHADCQACEGRGHRRFSIDRGDGNGLVLENRDCKDCNGTGVESQCARCHGSGCAVCEGEGKLPVTPCEACEGTGQGKLPFGEHTHTEGACVHCGGMGSARS